MEKVEHENAWALESLQIATTNISDLQRYQGIVENEKKTLEEKMRELGSKVEDLTTELFETRKRATVEREEVISERSRPYISFVVCRESGVPCER